MSASIKRYYTNLKLGWEQQACEDWALKFKSVEFQNDVVKLAIWDEGEGSREVLESGLVLRGLEGATYRDIYGWNTQLTDVLPIETKHLYRKTANYKFVSTLENAEKKSYE